MNSRRSRREPTGRTSIDIGDPIYMATAIDVFEKVRGHERAEQLRAAREADLLPYFRPLSSAAGPVVEMEGAERVMLGSNNYLGLTGDERVMQGARDALERYGTGLTGSRFLNGTTDLHLELEAELADWMGTEEVIVFTTGHQANVGTLGTLLAPGDTVIADSADHASILDGCLLSRAKLRPFRHGRLDKLEKMLERAAADGGGVLVVVEGIYSMEGDVAAAAADRRAVPRPRRAPDGRRGPQRGRARRARGRAPASCSGSRTARTCAWGRSRRASPPAAASSRARTRSSTSCACSRAPTCSPLRACRPRRARRSPRCASCAPRRARGCSPACSRTPRTSTAGCTASASRSSSRWRWAAATGATVSTPIVPVLVGDDWKAVLLWRALYDAGVYVNVALHPAVAPGGALLRTSVMATHDRPTLDRALDAFARVKSAFEAEHGPLPAPSR